MIFELGHRTNRFVNFVPSLCSLWLNLFLRWLLENAYVQFINQNR
jgi:hypothetical protein